MKLYYWKSNNFGDEINPWLWPKLLPNYFDDNRSIAFLGIGTLINDRYVEKTKNSQHKIIFSTGSGYENKPFSLDNSYKIYCLRGPLSAQKLGVSETLAITDGALLVRDFLIMLVIKKEYKFAYMPHWELAGEGWASACEKIGIAYIDPSWPSRKVLVSISKTNILLTEAMHGAIIADAFRVPWIPIVSNSSILPFKWQDWCASIDVEYQPTLIERLHHPSKRKIFGHSIKNVRDWTRQKRAAQQLLQITQMTRPTLSTEQKRNECSTKLYEKLELFKQDWEKGVFT